METKQTLLHLALIFVLKTILTRYNDEKIDFITRTCPDRIAVRGSAGHHHPQELGED